MCTCERHKYIRGWNVCACFLTAALYICSTCGSPWSVTANTAVSQQFGLFSICSTALSSSSCTTIGSMQAWQQACAALIIIADVISAVCFVVFLVKFILHLREPKYERHIHLTVSVIVLQFICILVMITMLILFTVQYAVNIQAAISVQSGSSSGFSSTGPPQVVFLWPFGMAWGTLAFNIVTFIIELIYYPAALRVIRSSQLKS